MSHLRVPSSPLFNAARKRHHLSLGLVSSSCPSILSSSSISAGVGQRASFYRASPSAQRSHASTSDRGNPRVPLGHPTPTVHYPRGGVFRGSRSACVARRRLVVEAL